MVDVAVKRTADKHSGIGSNIGSDCAYSKSMYHIFTAVKGVLSIKNTFGMRCNTYHHRVYTPYETSTPCCVPYA